MSAGSCNVGGSVSNNFTAVVRDVGGGVRYGDVGGFVLCFYDVGLT